MAKSGRNLTLPDRPVRYKIFEMPDGETHPHSSLTLLQRQTANGSLLLSTLVYAGLRKWCLVAQTDSALFVTVAMFIIGIYCIVQLNQSLINACPMRPQNVTLCSASTLTQAMVQKVRIQLESMYKRL